MKESSNVTDSPFRPRRRLEPPLESLCSALSIIVIGRSYGDSDLGRGKCPLTSITWSISETDPAFHPWKRRSVFPDSTLQVERITSTVGIYVGKLMVGVLNAGIVHCD